MACNLHALNKQELREHGEEAIEFGGYFIVNGIERIIRLLINQRRHYIMGMVRGAYARRGATFTEFATAIRCVSPDETSITVRTHYMTNGSARLAFVLRRQEFYIPARTFHAVQHHAQRNDVFVSQVGVVLKALIECSDREIFDKVRWLWPRYGCPKHQC